MGYCKPEKCLNVLDLLKEYGKADKVPQELVSKLELCQSCLHSGNLELSEVALERN